VVLPTPKVAVPVKFSDYRPISLLACLSKVLEVLMARQMEAHIRRNELLTVFQSGFCRHHSTTVAVLKVTEDIRSNKEDGQVTVLVLLDFSQPFDMVIHGMLLCKLRNLQNYSDGAWMLVESYLNGRRLSYFLHQKRKFFCGENTSLSRLKTQNKK
jgi:small basic protein